MVIACKNQLTVYEDTQLFCTHTVLPRVMGMVNIP